MPRVPAAAETEARSFWAQELPALGGTSKGLHLQSLAKEAQEICLAALASRDAVKLDELASVLVEIQELVSNKTHPILAAAIRQAGVQKPRSGTEAALLASPTVHDLVTLLSALSAQVTYGVALPAASSQPPQGVEGVKASQNSRLVEAANFRREVAELRRSLELKIEEEGEVSPRFSKMAHAIISREEQLQRQQEVVRSHRAANQAGLSRVRRQLGDMGEQPKDKRTEVYRVLLRMEKEHVQAAMRWEYKRETLQQERQRLMEMAMKAFCKVVYVDRGLEYRTLMSNFRGQGDPQVLASSFDKPKPQRMAAERYLYGQRASGSSGPGSGTLSPTPSVHVPSQTPYKYRAQSPSPTPSES